MTNHEAASTIAKLSDELSEIFVKFSTKTREELTKPEVSLTEEEDAGAKEFIGQMQHFRTLIAGLAED